MVYYLFGCVKYDANDHANDDANDHANNTSPWESFMPAKR